MLGGDTGELNEEQREFLRIIVNNSTKLAELISNLLDVQRMESGELELKLEELQLDKLLRRVAEAFRATTEEKGLSFEVDIEEGLTVRADGDRLAQAFSNLISNAVKYTEEGSVMVRAGKEDRKAMIEVEDTGIGMSQEEIEQLFTRFFQADGTYIRRAGGTGLGLFLAKAIVDRHGGKISVKSEPGMGSTFTVILPLSSKKGRRAKW
jgi:signal transduction histidine kinase